MQIKQNIRTQTTNKIFEELHISLRQAGIVDHSVNLLLPDLKINVKKEWTEEIRNT